MWEARGAAQHKNQHGVLLELLFAVGLAKGSCTQGDSNLWSHELEMPPETLAGCPGLGLKRCVVPRSVVPRGAVVALCGRSWAFHPGEQPGKFMPCMALSHSLGKMLGKQAEPHRVAPRCLLNVEETLPWQISQDWCEVRGSQLSDNLKFNSFPPRTYHRSSSHSKFCTV